MNEAFRLALEQIKDITEALIDKVEIINYYEYNSALFVIEISIYCKEFERIETGLQLHDRERFKIFVPLNFPLTQPSIEVMHDRFANFSHVGWKRYLCLYQTPSEWDPSDGLYGFIERLITWLKSGAVNQLDPTGMPLHPPAIYNITNKYTIVPTASTPKIDNDVWFGLGELNTISENTFEIISWSDNVTDNSDKYYAAAILLPYPMPFEFPIKIEDLFIELEKRGIAKSTLYNHLIKAESLNQEDRPLYIILGTAMRGVKDEGLLQQHLSVWRLESVFSRCLRLGQEKFSQYDKLKEIGEKAIGIINDWAKESQITWCRVLENRPEVTIRRDKNTSLEYFNGKTVCLLGCGALGSHIAEYLTRANVKKLYLYDKGIVHSGIIVRQLFNKTDIGKNKAIALSENLKRINNNLLVDGSTEDCINLIVNDDIPKAEVDLIIDTTASKSVSLALEMSKKINKLPIVTLMLGHEAKNCIATLCAPGYSGGPVDITRKSKLITHMNVDLKPFEVEFWPKEPRTKVFQPEPGCSDTTFIGSATDVSMLSALMLNLISDNLIIKKDKSFIHFFSLKKAGHSSNFQSHIYSQEIENDFIIIDSVQGYELRISSRAIKELNKEIETNNRINSKKTETGGHLFGEIDDLLKIVWITDIIGPPKDSKLSVDKFVCGVFGIKTLNESKKKLTGNSVKYIGTWHTHPGNEPFPSTMDFQSIFEVLSETKRNLFIICGIDKKINLAAFLFDTRKIIKEPVIEIKYDGGTEIKESSSQKTRIGLSLSGGGSRAIAFHLGCMRALEDRGILRKIDVISSVSGGAIIGAVYAYNNSTFSAFDKTIVNLLKKGLVTDILLQQINPKILFPTLFTNFTARPLAHIIDLMRVFSNKFYPPFRRWASRTTAFREMLDSTLFKGKKINALTRNNLNSVINACELRTGTAFRFGNKESGCWRYGEIKNNNVDVATAVAASAAFPVLLPAIDTQFEFINKKGECNKSRVFLTDGGVYDNLGISCLEPNKSTTYSYNVFSPEYIICCSAGEGQPDYNSFPFWWGTRMAKSFMSVHRKTQDSGMDKLHIYKKTNQIRGFILPYLGQQDDQLPYKPQDFVTREEVCKYPTDFFPMKEKDIELITKRGEQLTNLLMSYYLPEL